ncbi:MAG: hypothetical protein ACO3JL_16920 [Myxococcota bacterium]
MTPKTVGEVTRILESRSFKEWLRDLERCRKSVRVATDRYTELLTQVNLLEFRAELVHRRAVDTLDRANQFADESVQLANEAAQLENDSFEAVSQYEAQRDTTTKVWQRLGALDVEIEETPDESAKKKLLNQRDRLNLDYLREDTRKQKLWATVERLWVRNISKGLELREKKRKAQVVRQEAEAAFAQHRLEADQAIELRVRAEEVAAEVGEREQELMLAEELAPERFDCLLHHEFLYWPAVEDNKWVYAVPVIHDEKNYGVLLAPGALYRCRHDLGVDGLERLMPVGTAQGTGEKLRAPASASRGDGLEPALAVPAGDVEDGSAGDAPSGPTQGAPAPVSDANDPPADDDSASAASTPSVDAAEEPVKPSTGETT